MENELSIRKLQKCIKSIDYKRDLNDKYMLKLMEEVGELAEVIRKNKQIDYILTTKNIKHDNYKIIDTRFDHKLCVA